MLLQRLIADKDIGFNYDYMGSAEYEFGATRNGRMELAQAFLEGEIFARVLKVSEVYNPKDPGKSIEVVALARKSMLDMLEANPRIRISKESFRFDNRNIIGWMNVGTDKIEPLIMIRTSVEDSQKRINDFIRPFIDGLREEAKN